MGQAGRDFCLFKWDLLMAVLKDMLWPVIVFGIEDWGNMCVMLRTGGAKPPSLRGTEVPGEAGQFVSCNNSVLKVTAVFRSFSLWCILEGFGNYIMSWGNRESALIVT